MGEGRGGDVGRRKKASWSTCERTEEGEGEKRARCEVRGGDWPGGRAVAGRSPRLVTPLERVRVAWSLILFIAY